MAKMDSMLWHELMGNLRTKHAAICRQWFEELEAVALESGTLVVRTSNSVQQNYLQSRCLPQFIEAAQSVTGKLIGVQFVNGTGPMPQIEPKHKSNGTHSHGNSAPAGKPNIEEKLVEPDPEALAISRGSNNTQASSNAARFEAEHRHNQIILSPDYSFATFVTGPENSLAHAASVAVANQPGNAYNPLFIHGGVGLGKTHLLQAICQAVVQRDPNMRICYLSCERFVNDFLDCVQNGLMQDFRARYRNVDLLVIDDIQFLSKLERTQEEFFHTFNELYQVKKQIVLSSDRPPSEIQELEERLVSRFQWGLVADVSRPTYETRVAIVRAKAKLRGLEMPDDAINFIAERIETNARELEGAITSLQANAAARHQAITAALAYEVLGGTVVDPRTSQVKLQTIIDAVTLHYNVKLSDLQSKSRQKSIAEPRQVCMWLARKRTRFSLQEIGGYFGGRDHTTVMHSIRTVDDRISTDSDFGHAMVHLDNDITRRMSSSG